MIVCIKHRDYRGDTPPILSCKTCCTIFIGWIKLNGSPPTTERLADEARERNADTW